MARLLLNKNGLAVGCAFIILFVLFVDSRHGLSGGSQRPESSSNRPVKELSFARLLFQPFSLSSNTGLPGSVAIQDVVAAAEKQLEDRVRRYDVTQGERELGVRLGNLTREGYEEDLRQAWDRFFRSDSAAAGSSALNPILAHLSTMPLSSDHPARQPVPPTIYTTDMDGPHTFPEQFKTWRSVNEPDGWEVRYVSDDQIDAWLDTVLPGTAVTAEMKALRSSRETGVVRADLFRYLVLLLNGGVYTDTDTACILPIRTWGKNPSTQSSLPLVAALPELLKLAGATTGTDDNTVKDDDGPSLVIALESDSRDPNAWRDESFVRGIQVVQWTLLAKRGHPVMLDVIGRGLSASQARHAAEHSADNGGHKDETHSPGVLDWTGPGAFTDAVLRYLLVRHGVSPFDLSGLTRPERIGDVLIMPLHSFRADASEGYQGDDKVVWHGFLGRWKHSE